MKNLSDISVIEALMKKHGVTFNKGLGQNFLIDDAVCPAMADAAGLTEDTCVVEIGPGVGVLTAQLAKRAGKVIAFELDKRLLPVLKESLSDFSNVEIINEDILKADLPTLFEEKCQGFKVKVCANLPYYITSPVIMALLESELDIVSITVMVQKEAAERLCAAVGTRDGGAVTAAVSYYADSQILFEVGRDSFLPPPKVDSAVIQLTVRKKPPVEIKDKAAFFRTVKAAFMLRRKTAENSISAGLSLSKETVAAAIAASGLDKSIRAEKMTMQDFENVTQNLLKQ